MFREIILPIFRSTRLCYSLWYNAPPTMLPAKGFTVQILYSLQLNCTYNNYTEAAATCSAAQQHSTFTVQTVQSATELYLQ